MGIDSSSVSNMGSIKTVIPISADSTSATEYEVIEGSIYVALQNNGSDSVWMGDEDVDPSALRGLKLPPSAMWIFENVEKTFSVYFKCAAGESTTVSVIEG